jgi:DNA-binding response OmpR family regulator
MAEILIIDDDPDILSLLFDTLSHAGHDVRVEPDGDSGLAAAVGLPPDLVLLDWMMRGRRRPGGLPHLCGPTAAGRSAGGDALGPRHRGGHRMGFAAGADAYIVKPFSPRALVWRIERCSRRVALR